MIFLGWAMVRKYRVLLLPGIMLFSSGGMHAAVAEIRIAIDLVRFLAKAVNRYAIPYFFPIIGLKRIVGTYYCNPGDMHRFILRGANPYAGIIAATGNNKKQKIEFLLSFVDVNATQPVDGVTLLSQAISKRDEELVKIVLAKGADPHMRSKISVKSQAKLSALEHIKKEEEVDESLAGNKRWAVAQEKFEESRKRLAVIKGLVEGRVKELEKTKIVQGKVP
jgi:hypothetical protein